MVALIPYLSQFRNFVFGLNKLQAGEMLFRHCVYPISFTNKRAFKIERFWRLYDDKATRTIEASVACQRFAPTLDFIHAYGCRLAAGMNETKDKNGGSKEKDRRIYCGAYGLTVGAVRGLVGADNLSEISSAEVTHKIEGGEIAHAAVVITLAEGYANLEGTKTAILDRLWNANLGPAQHKCVCDAHRDPHPANLLPNAPAGRYVDKRSVLIRLWHRARFWLYQHARPREL